LANMWISLSLGGEAPFHFYLCLIEAVVSGGI
jgi:hypothetical protein